MTQKTPEKIASFRVDHTRLAPGMYISRVDGDVVTYDLRTRRPNAGDYMDHVTMHTLEHLFATYVRSSEIGEKVLYFGPMGCQTGFYLLVRDLAPETVYDVTLAVLRRILAHEGEVFGASAVECGNYRTLALGPAKAEAEAYLAVLEARGNGRFSYEEDAK